ncbi:WD40 repeat domain-containing protein [Trichormus azollae]|jgi:WD40 repeat protein|uniref:WD40 repeat domain-containing protein n=1 Tax=Trichormus azollae TaxID=1164 RepID=UPI0001956C39|nr:hypothetical protein [Trichormus azollae]
MDYYSAALIELSGENINQKFAALEIEDDLETLKAKLNSSSPQVEITTVSITNQLPHKWQCVKILKGHFGAVNAVAIHPDGGISISGSDDRQVNLWNLKTGKSLSTYIFSLDKLKHFYLWVLVPMESR